MMNKAAHIRTRSCASEKRRSSLPWQHYPARCCLHDRQFAISKPQASPWSQVGSHSHHRACCLAASVHCKFQGRWSTHAGGSTVSSRRQQAAEERAGHNEACKRNVKRECSHFAILPQRSQLTPWSAAGHCPQAVRCLVHPPWGGIGLRHAVECRGGEMWGPGKCPCRRRSAAMEIDKKKNQEPGARGQT